MLFMSEENCQLWELDVKAGLHTTGHRKIDDGPWDVLVARLGLFSTPNGKFRITSDTRSCLFTKEQNQGNPMHPGALTVTEDSSVVRMVQAPPPNAWG
jgi:hypothetical protein